MENIKKTIEVSVYDKDTYDVSYIKLLINKDTKILDVFNYFKNNNKSKIEIELEDNLDNIINFIK